MEVEVAWGQRSSDQGCVGRRRLLRSRSVFSYLGVQERTLSCLNYQEIDLHCQQWTNSCRSLGSESDVWAQDLGRRDSRQKVWRQRLASSRRADSETIDH